MRTGRCCCGQCSITVEGEPSINGICHCGDCRKRTGTAFGWSAYFPDDQVLETSGDFSEYRLEDEHHQVRYFCPRCGSTLFWKTKAMSGMTGVAGGSFAECPLPEPTLSLRTERACSWLELPKAWELR